MTTGTLARALVVDDEHSTRMLIEAALEMHDFEVEQAVDGHDALMKLDSNAFDIVLLDINMPGLNGLEVCRLIRQLQKSDLPIIIVSGSYDVSTIHTAFRMGATDLITKPINWTLIGYRVRNTLQYYRLMLEHLHTEARNSALLNAQPDLVINYDDIGTVLGVYGKKGEFKSVAIGSNVADIFPQNIVEACIDSLNNPDKANTQLKFSMPSKIQRYSHISCEIHISRSGNSDGICLVRDTSRQDQNEEKIEFLSKYDPLTHLLNRHSFRDQLGREIHRAGRAGQRIAVLVIDLDGFTKINNSAGHEAADVLLTEMSERISKSFRVTDEIANLVGNELFFDTDDFENLGRSAADEFTVFIPSLLRSKDALVVAQRIQRIIQQPVEIMGMVINLSACVGISLYPDDAEEPDLLIKYAYSAMYAAKSLGVNQSQFYNKTLTERAISRLKMESSLKLALERDEFFLFYQPQYNLETNSISSVEALIRWNHPELGCLSPIEFISIAEEINLISDMGEWVIRTACEDITKWDCAGLHDIRVAINLSPFQMRDPLLAQRTAKILADTAIEASRLEMEITEGVLVEDLELAVGLLKQFSEMGMEIAIDDFGTGFSSLSYLKKLPVSNLKIDKSFIDDVCDSRESEAIVRAIITLAKSLNIRVTAEGVETNEQLHKVKEMGCHFIQGYLFGKPQSFNDILDKLST
jgi:predicted signal transduction protein with EAL and GGDEF domain/CheY-like chemotaxis protein